VSSVWNFGLTETWVFAGVRQRDGMLRRGLAFVAVNNAALGLTLPALFLLTSLLGMHYLMANLVTIFAMMLLRYIIADRVIWKVGQPLPAGDVASAA
jgi:putative flippase GtrA